MVSCSGGCKGKVKGVAGKLVSFALEYDTVKHVHVRNLKVGLIFRTIQFLVLVFIVVYILWYSSGIWEHEAVRGTVTTKLKGVSVTNGSGEFANAGDVTWDEAEYVIPPREPKSFFIMTNMWITHGQKLGECPESPSVRTAKCSSDANCSRGAVYREGHGAATGRCNTSTGTCEVKAWCPVEEEDKNVTGAGPKLLGAEQFTVLVKNTIQFPNLKPGFSKRNIPTNDSFLRSCLFDKDSDENKTCPIFTLGAIVDLIPGDVTFQDLAVQGGVVGLNIKWDCDLNWNSCSYVYDAARVDTPDYNVSPGYNFRYARYWQEEGVQARDLYKAYGILFQVDTVGQGRIASIKQIFISFGSGISYLVLATYVTDFFVMYCLRKSAMYSRLKYHKLEEDREDTFVILDDTLVDSTENYGSLHNDTKPLESSGYVLAHATSRGYHWTDQGPSHHATPTHAAADTLVWQGLASVVIPGAAINRVCWAGRWALRGLRSPALRRWGVVALGLSVIPFIIQPIDRLVDRGMDSVRPSVKRLLTKGHSSTPVL